MLLELGFLVGSNTCSLCTAGFPLRRRFLDIFGMDSSGALAARPLRGCRAFFGDTHSLKVQKLTGLELLSPSGDVQWYAFRSV